jgi:hypothetical protein
LLFYGPHGSPTGGNPHPAPIYYGCGCGCTHGCDLTPTPAPNGSGTRGHPHPRLGLPSLIPIHHPLPAFPTSESANPFRHDRKCRPARRALARHNTAPEPSSQCPPPPVPLLPAPRVRSAFVARAVRAIADGDTARSRRDHSRPPRPGSQVREKGQQENPGNATGRPGSAAGGCLALARAVNNTIGSSGTRASCSWSRLFRPWVPARAATSARARGCRIRGGGDYE